MGDVQPDETNIKLQTAHHANINNNDDILTQDKEDAPVLDVKKNNKQKKSVENQEIKKQTVEETPKVDVNALYTKKKANGNEGETGKAGDQGKVYGDKNVKTHGNGGSGGGNGSGNGTGNGNGNGSGSGNGSEFGKRVKSPVSYSLKGRKSLALPKPPNNFKEGGIVVVEITVDRKGNVIKAIPGYRGTTSTNETLINMAKQAALNAKFDPNPDAAEEQKGTITYNFIIGN
jgi:outer membrane biosynthesis protein TonB